MRARLRWWAAWLRWAAETVGYVVRPYDAVRDARRWRWQRRARCGRQVWAALTVEERAALVRGARDVLRRRGG